MKKILVISRNPWVRDHSLGNTLYDFFADIKDFEIYSLCLKEAPTVCNLTKKNFYISEIQIIDWLLHSTQIGKITQDNSNSSGKTIEDDLYENGKKVKLEIFRYIREILWDIGKWKNENLLSFLNEASPDIIFFPDFPCIYAHKVLNFIKSKLDAKVVIFHADDCYTLKHFSLSPLFWLYRLRLRKWVAKSVKLADLHYVISDVQKIEYDKLFHVNNKILAKFGDFSGNPKLKEIYRKPLQLVYTGNIELNRWKSLGVISDALKEMNKDEVKVQLRIYTATSLSKRMENKLNDKESSFIMGKISAEKVEEVQNNADILVHVESMDLKNRLKVRQSFSTKIVDYLKRGRAILAVGPKEVASIKHLKDNNCALIARNKEEVIELLTNILNNRNILDEIALRAYSCGKQYHDKKNILKMLHDDMMYILNK